MPQIKEGSPPSTALKVLGHYVRPFLGQVLCSLIFVSMAATAVLMGGRGLRTLINEGFSASSVSDGAFAPLIAIGVFLAIVAFLRTLSTASLAEKIVAAMRADLLKGA